MPTTLTTLLLVLTVILVLSPTGSYAFGAGDIPDFAYLNGKAFRHGDIENILENLAKHVGGPAGGAGLLGFATSVLKAATGGSKFSKMDVKRVYFGNWLRDYSQAMDIAGLTKLSADTINLIIAVLGFMTFGFATEEFEVTQDRLGVYLPVEHIDNPKGYGETEGDARQIHPKLRPPVNPRELEVDERTGMKRYMASENEGWDTSTAHIRRILNACIEHGRRARGHENPDLFEAFRLLGTGLHTLEDLLAHSNWCEIALRKMGHEEVFCHVGDNVIIDTPNGPAPPLVTGTFGGADFLHSLLGEAGDKLSQASVTDLASKMDQASQGGDSNVDTFKAILGKLPIGGNEDKVNKTNQMHEQSKAYHFDPNNIAPPEVQRELLDVLKWRDDIMREVTEAIEMVPGLSDLVDEFSNAMNAFVYTILAPYVVPMITEASGILDEGSKAVINQEDQYQVFDDPNASDPSHSLLSKDHFALLLNEPAGKIAQIVVEYSVDLIVKAWSDNSNPDSVLDRILEAFHHPYYATGNSRIQDQMFEHMERWLGGLGPGEVGQVIERLTKQSVRDHKNKRIGSEDMDFTEPGYGGHSHGAPSYQPQSSSQRYQQGSATYSGGEYSSGGGYSGNTPNTGHGQYKGSGGYGTQIQSGQARDSGAYEYGGGRQADDGNLYGRGDGQQTGYGGRSNEQQSYDTSHSGRKQESNEPYSQNYGSRRRENEGYGGRRQDGEEIRPSYGISSGQETYNSGYSQGGGGRYQESESYGQQQRYNDDNRGSGRGSGQESYSSNQSYGSGRDEGEGYGRQYKPKDDNDNPYGGQEYGRSEGRSRRDNDDDSRRHHSQNQDYTSSYAQAEETGYGSRSQHHGGDGDNYGRSARNEEGGQGFGTRSEGYSSRNESQRLEGYEQSDYRSGSGYNPSYGGDETYGAERLNIRDDDGDEDHHGRKKHHHRRKDEDD